MMPDESVTADLLGSDRRYFELAARLCRIGPFQLAWLPGFERWPAGAVCHQVDVVAASDAIGQAAEWLAEIEQRFSDFGSSLARVYTRADERLEAALDRAGYCCRSEIGFVRTEPARASGASTVLRPIESQADWYCKQALHADSDRAVDGHPCPASAWVGMERARAGSGGVDFYLVESRGQTHGTLGLMRHGSVLRIKNLYLRPGSRGRGIGTGILEAVAGRIDGCDIRAVGLVALPDSAGERFYRACGMQPAGEFREWTRSL